MTNTGRIMMAEELGVEINKEFILNNVVVCVESQETYDSREDDYVAIPVYDIQMYFRVIIDNEKSFRIKQAHLDAFELVLDDVASAAIKNARAKLEIRNILEMLFGDVDPDGPDVATFVERAFGGSALLFLDVMADCCRKHGVEKLYILPSSIHEALFVYDNGAISKSDLDAMVRDVSATQVEPLERLADHCYVYRLGQDSLEY